MKLQIPTSPTLHRALAGGFACAALALATGCQTVKKATPKLAFKPKVQRSILDPRDNVPSPYVRPRAIVKVRPDANPTPHEARTPQVETGSSISESTEPVAIERAIPFHSQSIIATTAVSTGAAQPAPLSMVTVAAPALAAPVRQQDSLFPVAVAPVVEPTPLELDTAIQAVDIFASAGRDLSGIPAVAVAPAPSTDIVLQELPQEPVIEEVAVTALADFTGLNPIVEEPATSFLPVAIASALTQNVALTAPVDLGQAPAEVEPLPTFAFKPMTYSVVKGDSLWRIGHAHGLTVAEIASFNNINASRSLKIGQTLELPPGAKFIPKGNRAVIAKKLIIPTAAAAVKSTSSKPKTTKSMPGGNTHVVVSGDSLSKIAQTYGVTVKQLCNLNSLTTKSVLQLKQKVKLGQVAKAARKKPALVASKQPSSNAAVVTSPTSSEPEVLAPVEIVAEEIDIAVPTAVAPALDISTLKSLPHVVGENDTLEIISGMYNSTPEWIKEANNGLTNNADLSNAFKGKEIAVPCRGISN
jgi:LysM repeat protein